ncbi:MAG: 4-(cytidine 5'-diphospho)-2-C-methyl-D-erythritol kinase [Bacteroidetes bacterium]|nr:4-(cytidine 5'-diphospho)-2-C-methyl-D-erythritol kinase [Bacteroidota bacterium]
MISFPNAKINLGLHVVEQRTDGFHNIETVFYPVSLCDILEIIPSEKKGAEFTSSGLLIPDDSGSNLIIKVYQLFSSRYPASGIRHPVSGIRIHLHKVIPMGAGLGGGSSDGANTIKMLSDLWKLDLSVQQLQDLARQLGSDCAFFIENKPVYATGKGDQFEPIDLDLSGYQVVIVVPLVHMSTPEAYSIVNPQKPAEKIREIIRLPVEQWESRLINDFEEPVMKKHPIIREIRAELYNQGAIFAAMSGSGAAVFGIFSLQSSVHSLKFDPSIKVFSF